MSIYRHKQGARLAEAVVTNGLIFLAGQVPENTEADAKAQTENVLGQIDALLAELDSTRARSSMSPSSWPISLTTMR